MTQSANVVLISKQILTCLTLFLEVYWLLNALYKTYGFKNNVKYPYRIVILYSCAETIVLIINNYNYSLGYLNFFIYVIIHFVLSWTFCILYINDSFMSKFITIPIYIYSLISAQGLAENIVSIIFSVNSDLQVCIYLILSKVILYFVSRFMLKYSIKAQYKVPKAYWMFMIFVLAINQSYILLMNAVSSGVFSKNLMIALQLAIFALNLLLYFLFEKIIENYEEKLKYSLINQQLYLQKQSLEEMEKANQTIKNFKHDIKNHIMCIELMLKDKDYNEINRYLSGLSQSMSTSYSFVKSGNKIVDAVLNSKLTYARARQIQMNIEANLSIEIGIEDFELCALLSNLVDNALEASEKVNEPEINIMIKIVKKYLVISITNRLSDNFVINPNFVTTKKDKENHGIGMSVIKSIVSHYEGNVSFSVENGLFNARVFLLNKIPGS